MTTLSWIHISDLHLTDSQAYDGNIVLHALLRDIAHRIEQHDICPDFIAVTGDIAFSGRSSEYKLAGVFFDELLQVTKVDRSRLFFVPGNHDVDRSLVTTLAALAGDALDERGNTNALLNTPGDRELMLARFAGYRAFVQAYLGSWSQFDGDRISYVCTFDVAGQRVAVLGLNSAWVSTSAQDETKRLIVGEHQARMAVQQASSAAVRIALLHHPLDLLRAFDRQDVEPLLCSGCDFILHGHMHQPGILQTRTPDAQAMIIAAGASYDTRQCPNSYNFVELDLSRGSGTVHLRRYSDAQGGFWANDTLTYRNVPDGVYRFDLPCALVPCPPSSGPAPAKGRRRHLDREMEISLFDDMRAGRRREQILFFQGASGIGKSLLMSELQAHCPSDSAASVNLASSADAVDIMCSLTNSLGGQFTRFYERLGQFTGSAEFATSSDQLFAGLDASLNRYRRAALLKAFFDDLGERLQVHPQLAPLTFFLDSFEQAQVETKGWLASEFTGCVGHTPGVMLVLAGQEVPIVSNDLRPYCIQLTLEPLPSEQWCRYVELEGIRHATREIVQAFYHRYAGQSLEISMALDSLREWPGVNR